TARRAGAVTAATTAGALCLGDLRRGEAQAGADLVDLQLDDRSLLTLAGLERTLPKPALRDDAHASLQRLRNALGRLPPDRAPHEQRVAVLPGTGLPVERTWRGRDGEVRDGSPARREPELGVVGQVADDRDDGLACHGCSQSLRARECWDEPAKLSEPRAARPWCAARTRKGRVAGRARPRFRPRT